MAFAPGETFGLSSEAFDERFAGAHEPVDRHYGVLTSEGR